MLQSVMYEGNAEFFHFKFNKLESSMKTGENSLKFKDWKWKKETKNKEIITVYFSK